jgi:2-polyprenyl-3-methyl-5-hydroxy-6-metoxy-1,4-benzoquinol methylase
MSAFTASNTMQVTENSIDGSFSDAFASSTNALMRAYPEYSKQGHTSIDGTVEFYSLVMSAVNSNSVVLDYGAGRGCDLLNEMSPARGKVRTFKGRCARIEGCDVDPVVLDNPYLDDAKLITGSHLPYRDDTFDVIVADWVFEHIEHPSQVAPELLRVLKPNGVLFARTPNKLGYIAAAARLMSDRIVRWAQPGREERDIFPKIYALNTLKDLRKQFPDGATVEVRYSRPEPAYFFGNYAVLQCMRIMLSATPKKLWPVLNVVIRKTER